MKKLLILLFLVSVINAQNLDSLYDKFLSVKGVTVNANHVVSANEDIIKCSTNIVNEIKQNFPKFSPKQKAVLSSLISRPTTDTSFVSPKGLFRIHFNKTGNNKPGYDLAVFAKAADSVYNFEINILKYPAPPSDNGIGGDDLYDIYLQNLTATDYGYTQFDDDAVTKGATFMVVDNDFSSSSVATHGIDGAKVTLAHEFHHAIQMGNYGYRALDSFYYELTSTSMEDFVFNEINDYVNYLSSYFSHPEKSFKNLSGYNLAIWNFYLKDNFGFDIIKEMWQLMPTKRAVECFDTVLKNHSTSLKVELNTFGIWTYFTNSRSVTGKYFKEASTYPLISYSMSSNFISPTSSLKLTTEPISNNFIQYIDGPNNIISIISNVDYQTIVSGANSTTQLDYFLATQSETNYRKLGYGYYSYIQSSNTSILAEANLINDQIVNSGMVSVDVPGFAYPQPFSYKKNNFLYLPANLNTDGYADLFVYSSSMNLVYSAQKRIVASEKIIVEWNGLDNNDKKLASGVYFYVVKCGGDVLKGKIVILNE